MANTLQNFYKQPANFLYIFATDAFIQKLGKIAAYVISAKKANEKKLLNTTAIDEGKTYEEAYNGVKSAFQEYYGMTPQKALLTLAEGGEVPGKDWSKGIYGIGKTNEVQVNFDAACADPNIVINENGQFQYRSGGTITTEIVSYGKNGADCVQCTDANGNTYTAVYTKKGGWQAGHFYDKSSGLTYNAAGKTVGAADMSSIWESLTLSFQKLIDWLLSLFNSQNGTNLQRFTAANTQPAQGDGWVSNAGVSGWILIAIAAGVLFTSGGLGAFWKSARKSKKRK